LKIGFLVLATMYFSLIVRPLLHAQAYPAATREISLSTFGAVTNTYTGLAGGKNLGITAGGDIGFQPYHLFYPSLEVRGTYPVKDGTIDAQKNILFGLRVGRYYNRLRPYADFLYGRARIDYLAGGYPNPDGTLLFISSVSGVFSLGGGFDYTLTNHFALKVDGQFQQPRVPVTSSGTLHSTPLTIGFVYRFGSPSLD
jgi:hypothetical protein